MIRRYVQAISLCDIGAEEPSATRDRLKDRFPRGATRRMTQLGLLVGCALDDVGPGPGDAVVYASSYAESRALEGYLESFPSASPTQFQTSIHPSAVQQAMITKQQPIGEFFPMTGWDHLVASALQTAFLCSSARTIFCGGEERGTWLLERGVASARSFAFSVALVSEPASALASLTLEQIADENNPTSFTLSEWFEVLTTRHSISRVVAPGMRLKLEWI